MADYLEDPKIHYRKKYPTWLKVHKHRGFTYKDYLSWDDDIRVELINGMVYMMAGTSEWHQSTLGDLFFQLKQFLKDKPCKPYVAPFDVRLFPKPDLSDKTVVQPDILVICDKSKIFKNGINGGPELVIEIMSPSSEGHDMITKKKLYEKAGVKEYLIVGKEQVFRYHLENGKYIETKHNMTPGLKLNLTIFPDCILELVPDTEND